MVALLVASCTAFPTADLKTYAAAFKEARDAGFILLDKVSPIIAASARNRDRCAVTRSGTPFCFNPRLVTSSGRPPEPASIAVRRTALDLISTYNNLLVDLAEGKSDADIRSEINDIVGLAKDFVSLAGIAGGPLPGLVSSLAGGPVADQLGGLVVQLERIRENAAARESIISTAPIIKLLLNALEEDTPKLYRIFRDSQLLKLPTPDQPNKAAGSAITADIINFHASLTSYVVLLRKTADALDSLSAAAATPVTSLADARAIIRQAVEIRDEAKTFWDTIRKVGVTQ